MAPGYEVKAVSQNPIVAGEADPYPRLARLREASFFTYYAQADMHYLLSYPAAMAFLREAQDSRQAYLEGLVCEHGRNAILEAQKQELAFQDPPRHTSLKRLVMQAFKPAQIKLYQPRLQALAQSALDRLPVGETFDLLSTLAEPLPAQALAELLGVPTDRRETLYQATRDIVAARGVVRSPVQLAAGSLAVTQLSALFEELCRQRRSHAEPDLITALLHAEDDGERLDHSSLLSVLSSLYAAGYGNVRNLIGNGLVALLPQRELMDQVRQSPQLWPTLIEEMLRYDSPTQATNPTVLSRPFSFEGQELPSGSRVTVYLAACNRDPAHFARPDDFVADRHPNDHLAFSFGTHFCPGAPLVRLQAEILLRELLGRFEVSLEGPLIWQKMDRFRGLERLLVSLRTRP